MQYFTGLKLYQVAKKRASEIGMDAASTKMAQLILEIQEREGNIPCFRKKEACGEVECTWQAACTAKMNVTYQ